MKKLFIIVIFILSGCTSNDNMSLNNDFNQFEKISFNEFELRLDEYSKNSNYPDIDN